MNSSIELIKPLDVQKYIDALDNILGVDHAYYMGDKDVEAIMEIIRMAKNYEDLIAHQQKELKITRAYLHDNGLEFDLLSYYIRNGG